MFQTPSPAQRVLKKEHSPWSAPRDRKKKRILAASNEDIGAFLRGWPRLSLYRSIDAPLWPADAMIGRLYKSDKQAAHLTCDYSRQIEAAYEF